MNEKEISDSTLESVTPADNDLMLIYDTSEGTTGKATIAGIAPKVAENIDIATLVGDTSNLIEASALPNLGMAADASQHDVNVAIDSLHQYDDTDYVEIARGLTPASQVNGVSLLAKRKGNVVTLRGYFEINLTGSTHLTLELLPAGSIPAKYRPSINSDIAALGYRNSETTYMIGRFFIEAGGAIKLGEYYTSGNDQAETTFNFTLTYVV